MEILSARNPKYNGHGGIDLEVSIGGLIEHIPFSASQNDSEAHGRELYARAIAGEFGPVAPAPEPVLPTLEEVVAAKLAAIRAARHAVEFGGMVYNGVMYDSDATARAKYGETARVFNLMPDLEIEGWKASDDPVTGLGIYVTMTKALLDALTLAGAQRDGAAFSWEQARQMEVAAAQTAAEVEAVSEVVY